MQDADRKLAWSGIFVLAVIAVELAWFLFVGPADHRGGDAPQGAGYDDNPFLSAAVWTAFFTLALTVSTALLWWQTRRLAEGAADQTKIMGEQIELTRKQFVATHRPRMIVRRIHYEGGLMNTVIVNAGTSDAILSSVYIGFGYKEWRGVGWTDKLFRHTVRHDRVPSGTILVLDPNAQDADFPMERIANMADRLFVFGRVAYEDENGTYRTMGFIRWYDIQFDRFEPVPSAWADSEMEYAD